MTAHIKKVQQMAIADIAHRIEMLCHMNNGAKARVNVFRSALESILIHADPDGAIYENGKEK